MHAECWQSHCSYKGQQAAVDAHRLLTSERTKTIAPERKETFGTGEPYEAVDVQRAGAAPGEERSVPDEHVLRCAAPGLIRRDRSPRPDSRRRERVQRGRAG